MISEETYYKNAAELTKRELQELLAGVSIEDISDQPLSKDTATRAAELGQIATSWPVIESVLLAFLKAQADVLLRHAKGMPDLMFARGAINVLDELTTYFRDRVAEYTELTKPAPPVNPTEIIPSVTDKGGELHA